MDLIKEFQQITKLEVKQAYPASKLTTISTGGAVNLVNLDSETQISAALAFLNEHEQKYFFLGAGSNLLISDSNLSAWVLQLGREFRKWEALGQGMFRVWGAMPLPVLARELAQAGFSGLEFAGGIPGTLGGAVRMNAGAHGSEMAQVIQAITWIDNAGEIHQSKISELSFSYRKCSLPIDAFIISADLQLIESDKSSILSKFSECLQYRKNTQPLTLPSFGSVFRNPEKDFAGRLIEVSGLKGKKIGGAEISNLHANWIVNEGKKASTKDVLDLISLVQETVLDKHQVMLEPEVVVWT